MTTRAFNALLLGFRSVFRPVWVDDDAVDPSEEAHYEALHPPRRGPEHDRLAALRDARAIAGDLNAGYGRLSREMGPDERQRLQERLATTR